MSCTKIQQQLNEARLRGENSITLSSLKADEKQELIECGFNVIERKGKYIISL